MRLQCPKIRRFNKDMIKEAKTKEGFNKVMTRKAKTKETKEPKINAA